MTGLPELVLAFSLFGSPVSAAGLGANPAVRLTYRDLSGPAEMKLVAGDRRAVRLAGALRFEPPPGQPTAGLGPAPRVFSADPLAPLALGRTYSFRVDPIPGAAILTERQTLLVRELYGRFHDDTLRDPAVAASAFQAAVWELVQERGAEPDLFAGTFRADYPTPEAAPEFVQLAQKYLDSLSGTESPDGPPVDGFEPVRLTGLPGADGVTPQSQLALRPLRQDGGTAPESSSGGSTPAPVGPPVPPADQTEPGANPGTGGGAGGGPPYVGPRLGGPPAPPGSSDPEPVEPMPTVSPTVPVPPPGLPPVPPGFQGPLADDTADDSDAGGVGTDPGLEPPPGVPTPPPVALAAAGILTLAVRRVRRR